MKSGNLNFLEPSGPLQACNGTALPLIRKHSELCIAGCGSLVQRDMISMELPPVHPQHLHTAVSMGHHVDPLHQQQQQQQQQHQQQQQQNNSMMHHTMAGDEPKKKRK